MDKLWDMVSELHDMYESGEISQWEYYEGLQEEDQFNPVNFIKDMYNALSEPIGDLTPNKAERHNIEMTSDKQRAKLAQLYNGYVHGDWLPIEDYQGRWIE